MAKSRKSARIQKSQRPRVWQAVKEPYSAPLAIPLCHESAWNGCGSDYGPFTVVRFNFLLTRSPLNEIGYGDAIENLEAAPGAQVVDRKLVRYEYECVTTSTILQEYLDNSEVVSKIAGDAEIAGPVPFKFGTELEAHLSSAFKESKTFESVDGKRSITERETTITVEGGSPPAVIAVPFQKHRMQVRLNHIDFLTVEYRKRLGGLRVERTKEPPLLQGSRLHTNYTSSGLPMGEFRYWAPIGGSSTTMISRETHFANHINQLHVEFNAPDDKKRKFYDLKPFSRVPSLYKISNAAFPLKAQQRATAWTDEELLAHIDAEPSEVAWIWEFRRHLRNRIR